MDRNEKIFRLVLYGSSYTNIAKIYAVTPVRIRQIVVREAYKLRDKINIPSTGNTLTGFGGIPAYSLKTLRSMKNRIITVLEASC